MPNVDFEWFDTGKRMLITQNNVAEWNFQVMEITGDQNFVDTSQDQHNFQVTESRNNQTLVDNIQYQHHFQVIESRDDQYFVEIYKNIYKYIYIYIYLRKLKN